MSTEHQTTAVDVHILDKDYRVACPDEEHSALIASANLLIVELPLREGGPAQDAPEHHPGVLQLVVRVVRRVHQRVEGRQQLVAFELGRLDGLVGKRRSPAELVQENGNSVGEVHHRVLGRGRDCDHHVA